MLFATSQSYHRVCRGFPPRCVSYPVTANLRGLGDSIDANDPCSVNPSDPVCVEVYGGQAAANKASVQSTADGGEIEFAVDPSLCRPGTTWDPSTQICAPDVGIATSITNTFQNAWQGLSNFISGGGSTIAMTAGSAAGPTHAPAAASMAGRSMKVILVLGLLGAASYGGYRLYEKRKRRG